ncbi:unnamed protein product, partial [Iphiclides podalirius]
MFGEAGKHRVFARKPAQARVGGHCPSQSGRDLIKRARFMSDLSKHGSAHIAVRLQSAHWICLAFDAYAFWWSSAVDG